MNKEMKKVADEMAQCIHSINVRIEDEADNTYFYLRHQRELVNKWESVCIADAETDYDYSDEGYPAILQVQAD